ncbi:sialate O-acetylesterase [Fulvivirgaceae bacterium BMA10]|uniref:Sialate O-acetylesterase n=1 Tax=Splendidivirga corallicola TaxID=3051826 RepID=A0ABT8KMF0_9BACT|nr:sialate O-acetylesterase [Fulvivirgaceae bacterium BMA10]
MRLKKLLFFVLIILPAMVLSQQKEVNTIRLFYLGGQSNMDGFGYNTDLPESLNKTFDDVLIFHGNPVGDDQENGGLGKWDVLKPGHGTGFSSNGNNNNLSNRFGIELSFVKRLQELYPNEKIALIKYSRGGTSIDSLAAGKFGSWEPDYQGTTRINQYDHFLTTIRKALSVEDIDNDGTKDNLVPSGILWMQGESDGAHTEEIALRYYSNLKRLMDLIRAAFHVDDLPVVLGKISDSWNDKDGKVWNYGELVQYAQEKFARTDGHATIVRNTRYYKYSDPWHYDSKGYIDLGKRFADAVYKLSSDKK